MIWSATILFGFFAECWLSQIQSPNPQGMSEDLVRWMLISFVFQESEIFRTITKSAMRYSTDTMPTLGLPIRSKILEDIEFQRKVLFTHLLDSLRRLQSQLLEQSLGCSKGCRAMMYGTLSQGMKSSSLLPLPLPPYASLNIDSALQQLRAIEGEDFYSPEKGNTIGKSSGTWKIHNKPLLRQENNFQMDDKAPHTLVRHNCRIEDHLKSLLKIAEGNIHGLLLSKYLDK
ncbi:hypothetical protein ACQKWADRAFT_183306 [Trichoderma austrokoningii]